MEKNKSGTRTLNLKDSSESKNANKKVECEYCQEVYSIEGLGGYKNHVKACQLYHEYLVKVESGYECSICLVKAKNVMVFFVHMRIKHANIFDKKSVKTKLAKDQIQDRPAPSECRVVPPSRSQMLHAA